MTSSRAALRKELRARRRAVSERGQAAAEDAVAAVLAPWLAARRPEVVAAYLATDGELSPAGCVTAARAVGATVVFPRIADDAMTFHVVGSEAELVEGRWGLMEPAQDAPAVVAEAIDVVLTPLVGFDAAGTRMGRGKAYYDRAFAFLAERSRPSSTVLIGLAHDVQAVARLERLPHDVAVDCVVTPSGVVGDLP